MKREELLRRLNGPRLKTSALYKKLVVVMCLVPKGKVATYGQIAKVAGFPGHARQVVWTLHSSSRKYQIPWHRIINSQGRIGLADEKFSSRQKIFLERESVKFDISGKVDLTAFGWKPKISEVRKILKVLRVNRPVRKKRGN